MWSDKGYPYCLCTIHNKVYKDFTCCNRNNIHCITGNNNTDSDCRGLKYITSSVNLEGRFPMVNCAHTHIDLNKLSPSELLRFCSLTDLL